MAAKTKPADPAPVSETDPTRLDNAFIPGAEYEGAPTPTAATVVKLWAGGEHAKALALFLDLKLKDADVADLCPGWAELRNQ